MKRQARVISTAAGAASTLVELESVDQCSRCRRGQGCGAAIFSAGSAAGLIQVRCSTQLSLEAGQQVLVEIDENGSQWLWLAFGAYGLPLLGMLLACAVASFVTTHWLASTAVPGPATLVELGIALAAVAGLAGGFFAWHLVAPRALASAQRSTCLQSARIVAINSVT